MKELGMDSN